MNWFAAYEIETTEAAADLGEPATLTVILRDLDNDRRSFAFVPIEPVIPGDVQSRVCEEHDIAPRPLTERPRLFAV